MKDNQEPNCRILKVEEVGDHWRGRTFPRIRFTGKWLTIAGIKPNGFVLVENPQHGVLVIQLIEDNQ